MIANICFGVIIALIGWCLWYSLAEWECKKKLANLNAQLDAVIDRYNKDVNEVKQLNDSLISVNRKLKWDICWLKSDLIEAKSMMKKTKVNSTNNETHTKTKKVWRPRKN